MAGGTSPRLVVAALVVAGALATTPTAAPAAQRFVKPLGATSGTCDAATPCDITYAVNTAAQAGDDVTVSPGTYFLGQQLNVAGFALHGASGQPRPVLKTSQGSAVAATAGAGVRWLQIEQYGSPSGSGTGVLYASASTASGLILITTAQSASTSVVIQGATLSDSVVYAGGAFSTAVDTQYTATVRNVTAIAPGSGGFAIYASSSGIGASADTTVVNTIARGSAADLYARDPYGYVAKIRVSYSNFRPGFAVTYGTGEIAKGVGNQSQDPVFVSSSDYHQQAASPTINAGSASGGLGAADIDGAARLVGSAPDIGADEFVPPPSAPPPADPTGPGPSVSPGPAPSGATTPAPVAQTVKAAAESSVPVACKRLSGRRRSLCAKRARARARCKRISKKKKRAACIRRANALKR